MRISYNWLKNYVDIKLSPEKLAELLTMAGLCVDSVHKKGDDSVLETEITSNRPDWLSYIGVAREVAALTGRKLKVPSARHCEEAYRPTKQSKKEIASSLTSFAPRNDKETRNTVSVKVDDKSLCPRYTARIIRDVKVGESPDWLKEKLEAVGVRSVNNIVDITNFCLFETGEPMHAFDIDKLSGRDIIVRKASKGEAIVAIDGTKKILDESMLVIADSKAPVAIAGVMGGLATEVDMSTKNILLEAAYFDPISVRRASKALALSTDSSYRFERRVDVENIKRSSDRATQLILELAGGEVGEFIDIGKMAPASKKINLKLDKLNKIIGVEISPSKARSILMSLGLGVRSPSKGVLKLTPPGFRYDLQNEIDMIEEVARIYGYGNIPETIPPVLESGRRLSPDAEIDRDMRRTLINLGLSEIITYSLLSKKTLSLARSFGGNVVSIKNPLSSEQEVMRPALIAGMLGAIRWNINRREKDLKLFELGRAYFKETDNSFSEKQHLAIGITGQLYDGWIGHPRAATLFDLKGIIETLFVQIGTMKQTSVKETLNPAFSPTSCAFIEVDGDTIGVMGQVDPKVLRDFDIKEAVYAAEIDCGKLTKHISLMKTFKESPKFPSVTRDISIVADKNIPNADIISVVKVTAGDILKNVDLVDRYGGGQIPEGKIGLTYRLEYRDPNRTLEDPDVQAVHSRIISALENNLGARLR
ncbi:MAG: phenylalanine--tRNA ligase subunit beta [Candidatus Omnitrophota bacterium]|nr:phenylalanine--tRNA ligase subunit beta [Candidatus Omnitrophota bacterium]